MTEAPRGPQLPIPLVVVTGFLGAGKTTLLNRVLADPALDDTVVIVNEFGEIGLDHLLVETVDEGLILLASGCLCCTIRGDLVATLEDLLRRRDNGRMAPFRRVVIETTGLADPAPVLQTVLHHPYLALRYGLAGVVTLVDAVNGMATLDAHPEAVKQAAVADRLVVTKTDLLGEGGKERQTALVRRLARLNPGAAIVDAAKGEANAALLAGLGPYDADGRTADVRAWLGMDGNAVRHAVGHADGHGHAHHEAHKHDVNRHDDRIRAFSLVSDQPIGRGAFEMFLDLLRSAHGPRLLRVKGIVALAEEPDRPVLIQGVQHVFHPPQKLKAWPDDDRRTRLVFILQDLDEGFVRGLWGAFLGEPGVDRPDAAALTANPLALHPGGRDG